MTLPFVLIKYHLSCELVIERGNVQPLALGQLLGTVIAQPRVSWEAQETGWGLCPAGL